MYGVHTLCFVWKYYGDICLTHIHTPSQKFYYLHPSCAHIYKYIFNICLNIENSQMVVNPQHGGVK